MCAASRVRDRVRRVFPGVVGCGFLAAAGAYAASADGSPAVVGLELAVPVAVGLVLIAYCGTIADRDVGGRRGTAVAGACLLSIALVALLELWSLYLFGLRYGDPGAVGQQTLLSMSVGAGVGAVIGHVYADLSEQLRKNGRLTRAVASSMDGIAIVEGGRHVYANDSYADLHGFADAADVVGVDCYQPFAPADRDRIDDEVLPALADRERWRGLLEGRRLDGTTFPKEVSATALDDGLVLIARDVSERRDRQQRIEVLNRVLRHNLRNAFTVIQGHAKLLAERDHPDVEEHHLEPIKAEAESLLAIADKARRVEHTLDGGMRTKRVDASTVAERVETIADDYPDATVDVRIDHEVRLPSDVTDAVRELIDNAVEYADGDRPTVEVVLRRVDPETGARAHVVVHDDGPGIPIAEREALQQGRETQLEHGSGLGLWLVKWTVTAAGGTLEFDDREPRGTTVRLSFPAAPDPGGPDAGPPAPADD